MAAISTTFRGSPRPQPGLEQQSLNASGQPPGALSNCFSNLIGTVPFARVRP